MRISLFYTVTLIVVVLFSTTKPAEASLIRGFLRPNITMNVLDHFMEGMKINELAVNTTECVHHTDRAYTHLSAAINNISASNWTLNNHFYLLNSLGNIGPMIRTCYNSTRNGTAEFLEHFNGFNNLTDFLNQTRHHLANHTWEFYKEGSALLFALEDNRTDEAAYQLGSLTRLLIDVTPTRHRVNNGLKGSKPFALNFQFPDLRPVSNFLTGFVNGTRILNSDNITHCVNETQYLASAFENATYGIANQTYDGFEHALFDLSHIFDHVGNHSTSCYGGLVDSLDILGDYNETLYSPREFAMNVVRNSFYLYDDAVSAYGNYTQGNQTGLGFSLGDTLFNLFARE